jgi:hypothetical protein
MHGQIERHKAAILGDEHFWYCRSSAGSSFFILLAAQGRENAEYYEEKTRTKQWTERQKRASERERASARASGARRCGWLSSSAVRVCGLGLLSAGYVLPGIPSPGLLVLSNSQKIWLPSLVWEILEDMTNLHILGGLRKERSCELHYLFICWKLDLQCFGPSSAKWDKFWRLLNHDICALSF